MRDGDEKCIGIDGRILLEWGLEKYGGKAWTGFICSG
jgi:hypothetical protein